MPVYTFRSYAVEWEKPKNKGGRAAHVLPYFWCLFANCVILNTNVWEIEQRQG